MNGLDRNIYYEVSMKEERRDQISFNFGFKFTNRKERRSIFVIKGF